jgi:hypothetical protein
MSISTNRTRPAVLFALLLCLVTAVAAVLVLSGASANGGPPTNDVLSKRLAGAPALDAQGADTLSGAAEARALGDDLEPSTPLPPGGTLDDIHYDNAVGLTPDVLKGVVQFNAACDWWLYLRDHPDAPDARKIVAEIPQWPVFREPANAGLAEGVASGLTRASGRVTALALVTANCEHP